MRRIIKQYKFEKISDLYIWSKYNKLIIVPLG